MCDLWRVVLRVWLVFGLGLQSARKFLRIATAVGRRWIKFASQLDGVRLQSREQRLLVSSLVACWMQSRVIFGTKIWDPSANFP